MKKNIFGQKQERENPCELMDDRKDPGSESDLWLLFREGDPDAFASLYRKIYRSLYSYGVNLGMDVPLARDAIQDLFLKLYANPELIKDVNTIRAFLFRSIKNYYLNAIQKSERYVDLTETEMSFSFDYAVDERITDEEDRKNLKEKIDRILDQLTPRQKEIVYLRFLHEMDYSEIAKIMNISEQGARNLLYKTFKKIRKNYPAGYFLLFLIKINSQSISVV